MRWRDRHRERRTTRYYQRQQEKRHLTRFPASSHYNITNQNFKRPAQNRQRSTYYRGWRNDANLAKRLYSLSRQALERCRGRQLQAKANRSQLRSRSPSGSSSTDTTSESDTERSTTMSTTEMDSETESSGYDTADSESQIEFEDERTSQRRNGQRDNRSLQPPQGQTNRRRRLGRRQRQRNRRNRRQHQEDAGWYIPAQSDQEDEVNREELIAENNNWIATLPPPPPPRSPVSPLAQTGRGHTITWTNDNVRVNLPATPSREEAVRLPPAHTNTEEAAVRPVRPSTRQGQRLPGNSVENVNFNLAQQMNERNRVYRDISQHASQLQMAMAAASASVQRLLDNSVSNIQHSNENWQVVNSWNDWDNDNERSEMWLNVASSERRREREPRGINRGSRQRRQGNNNRRNRNRRDQLQQRSSQLIHLPAEAMSSASRGWYNNNDLNAAREDNHQESNESVVPQADSSRSRHHHRHTNEDDTDHPFSRFDMAYQRQEERNAWRQRHRRRRQRQERREMENRRQNRRRLARQNSRHSSASEDESQPNLAVPRRRAEATVPTPPPLPPPDWVAPPRTRYERQGMLDGENNALQQVGSGLSPAEEPMYYQPTEFDAEDNLDADVYDDDIESLEALLKAYIDPAESNGPLGTFLRRTIAGGRVIVSRVRKRITKQYFRRGDFQVALADFRSLNIEHARQVLGVGFTATIDNMYRLTVKQNSSFGKPTLEIRPMNRRVRRKKVHVCYKIRYLGKERNRRNADRSTRIPSPV